VAGTDRQPGLTVGTELGNNNKLVDHIIFLGRPGAKRKKALVVLRQAPKGARGSALKGTWTEVGPLVSLSLVPPC
jgi:hypothetical protein